MSQARRSVAVACIPCVLAKVRCDSSRPCQRCTARGIVQECVDRDLSATAGNVKKKRRRAYKSCEACRIAKKSCKGGFPCMRCRTLGLEDTCRLFQGESAEDLSIPKNNAKEISEMNDLVYNFWTDLYYKATPLDAVQCLQRRRLLSQFEFSIMRRSPFEISELLCAPLPKLAAFLTLLGGFMTSQQKVNLVKKMFSVSAPVAYIQKQHIFLFQRFASISFASKMEEELMQVLQEQPVPADLSTLDAGELFFAEVSKAQYLAMPTKFYPLCRGLHKYLPENQEPAVIYCEFARSNHVGPSSLFQYLHTAVHLNEEAQRLLGYNTGEIVQQCIETVVKSKFVDSDDQLIVTPMFKMYHSNQWFEIMAAFIENFFSKSFTSRINAVTKSGKTIPCHAEQAADFYPDGFIRFFAMCLVPQHQ